MFWKISNKVTSCGKPRQKIYITDCGEVDADADLADFDEDEEEEGEQSDYDDYAAKDEASEEQENSASEPGTTATFETEDEQPK